jgi:glycosyltransferase involved in cell wall biosynthesis
MSLSYVIMTAAHNEAEFIEQTLQSVVNQTIPPLRWVILDDGSHDATSSIVQRYADVHPYIELIGRTRVSGHNLGSKVAALRVAEGRLCEVPYDLLANLDADIALPPDYYERLIAAFEADPELGLAGAVSCEWSDSAFRPRAWNARGRIQGAIQVFRRACYEDIGGYHPLHRGGGDSTAQFMAEMYGWRVRRLEDLFVQHLRPEGSAGKGPLRARFYQGRKDYALGYHPLFMVAKCLYRITEPPIALGALGRWSGYCWGALTREPRPLPAEVISYCRQRQLEKMAPWRRLTKRKITHG